MSLIANVTVVCITSNSLLHLLFVAISLNFIHILLTAVCVVAEYNCLMPEWYHIGSTNILFYDLKIPSYFIASVTDNISLVGSTSGPCVSIK